MARQAWTGPKLDVAETENAYELAIDLPGVPKEAIQVGVYENTVTIGAEVAQPKAEEERNWLLRERSSASSRAISRCPRRSTRIHRRRATLTACSTSRCRRSALRR